VKSKSALSRAARETSLANDRLNMTPHQGRKSSQIAKITLSLFRHFFKASNTSKSCSNKCKNGDCLC
jgi:hypothetical protein